MSMTVELESSALLDRFAQDRPVFHGRLSRPLRCKRFFQVFGCETGFLCLELTYDGPAPSRAVAIAKWCAAIWFGPLAIIVHIIMLRNAAKHVASLDLSNAMRSDDELVELARQRQHSFVARYDDIKWIRIERPDALERLLFGETLQGMITFRERTVGKVTIYIYDHQSMQTAIDALPRRLGERVDCRIAFDPRSRRFVAQ